MNKERIKIELIGQRNIYRFFLKKPLHNYFNRIVYEYISLDLSNKILNNLEKNDIIFYGIEEFFRRTNLSY